MIHENFGSKTINDLSAEMSQMGATLITLKVRGQSGKVARLVVLAKDDDAERIHRMIEESGDEDA